jgi:hypothetical protein
MLLCKFRIPSNKAVKFTQESNSCLVTTAALYSGNKHKEDNMRVRCF